MRWPEEKRRSVKLRSRKLSPQAIQRGNFKTGWHEGGEKDYHKCRLRGVTGNKKKRAAASAE